MLLLFTLNVIPPPCTLGPSCTWVVYDHRPVLDCKDTKYFLYLNTFAQIIFNNSEEVTEHRRSKREIIVLWM